MNANIKLFKVSLDFINTLNDNQKCVFIDLFKSLNTVLNDFRSENIEIVNGRFLQLVISQSNDDYLYISKWLYKGSKNVEIFLDNLLMIINVFIRSSNFNMTLNNHAKRARMYYLIQTYHLLVSTRINSAICVDLVNIVNELSEENDFYELSLISNMNLLNIYYSRKDILRVNNYKNRYTYSLNDFTEYNELKYFVEELALKYNYSIYYYKDHIKEIEFIIEKYTGSISNDKFIFMFYITLLKFSVNYSKGLDYTTDVLNFRNYLLSNEYVVDRRLFYEGNANIALHFMLLKNWDLFIEQFNLFFNDSNMPSAIKLNLLILKYLQCLHFHNFSFIDVLICKIGLLSDLNFFTNYKPLLSFLYANYCHLKADYKQSILSLQEASSLISDKSGYGLGIRILELMNFVRWGKDDQMDNALINLKNQITFLKKSGTIKPRFIFIYKILVKLHSSAYDYNKCYRLFYDELKLMASSDLHWSWDIRSPEVIRFDTWFFQIAGIIPDWDLEAPTHIKSPDA
jgi:hypothetical protein